MTGADVLADVRGLMKDTAEPYRWTEAVLLGYLRMGFRRLYQVRPDVFLADTGGMLAVPAVATAAEDLSNWEDMREALGHYVAAAAYEEDSENAGDEARAERQWRGWIECLGLGSRV